MFGRVLELVVAVHAPFSDRSHDLQVRRESRRRDVEAHLVVALAGAPMRDGLRTLAARDLHHHRRDQRPAQRGRERIFLLVDSASLQRRPDEHLEEGKASIGDVSRGRARLQRPSLDRVQVLFLAEVDGERDHVPALVLQPADRD